MALKIICTLITKLNRLLIMQIWAWKPADWQVQKQLLKYIMNLLMYLQELGASKALFLYRSKIIQSHTRHCCST